MNLRYLTDAFLSILESLTHDNMLDAQWFYDEQLHRMECLSQESVAFEDVVAQMHDMIMPKVRSPTRCSPIPPQSPQRIFRILSRKLEFSLCLIWLEHSHLVAYSLMCCLT